MAPLPPVAGVARIDISFDINAADPAGSRFFVSYTGGPPNETDLGILASSVADQWSDGADIWYGMLSEDESLVSVTCTDLSSDTGAVGTWTGTNSGSNSGDQLTAGVCAIVNHQITRRYRGGRPRTYLRVGTQSDLSNTDAWSTSFAEDIASAWHSMMEAILATTGMSITLANSVNVSYFKGFTVFTTPTGRARNIPTLRDAPVIDTITDTTANPKIGSQRRRRGKIAVS